MLKATRVGDITEIKLGRSIDGSNVLYWVAAYLVDGILIDTGCDYTKTELVEFLVDKRLSAIVNTHYHEDHVGANALLKQRLGLRALAHQETIRLMGQKYDLYPFQREIWGYPDGCTAEPVQASLVSGELSFRIVETPGHCRGHISLFEEKRRALFSGDTWVGERPKIARAEENQHQLICDLGKFEELRPNMMFAS